MKNPFARLTSSQRTVFWIEVFLVALVFFVAGAWPVPDTNEAHYLLKATSYWNPDFCQGDFFLESADAHLVFYLTFGWMTLFASPEVVVWVGRILTWGLLAWAWCRLSRAVLPVPWWSVLTAALWVLLIDRFAMAGEWVIGGFEAKGFAYLFVLLGLEALVRRRWNRMWIFFGAGALFHVLVGGWAVVAGMIAWVVLREEAPSLREMVPGLLIGGLLSLPGLLPVLSLSHEVNAAVVDTANQIYVYLRLPHHLNFATFSSAFVFRFGFLMFLWVALRWYTPEHHPVWRVHAFVTGSVLICMIGVILTHVTAGKPIVGASLLRFYWFRLSDVVVPLGVALGGPALILLLRKRAILFRGVVSLVVILAGFNLVFTAAQRLTPVTPRSHLMPWWGYRQWVDACQWIDRSERISNEAKFLTPRFGADFKWYAHRPDLVNWKDIPQDPRSIVLWWQRMLEIHAYDLTDEGVLWFDSLAEQGESRLLLLGQRFQVDYAITVLEPRLNLPVEYENDSFIIYRLAPPAELPESPEPTMEPIPVPETL